MMKRTMWAALTVAVVGLFGATPADAQDYPDYKFDIGVFGGGSWYSAMLDDEHLGEGSDDVRYKAGWVTGLQATMWATPRFGIRAHGAYSERPITGGAENLQFEGNLLDDVNLWSASADLLIRLVPAGYNMAGYSSMPYLALGIGGKNTNPPGDVLVGNPDDEDETGALFDVVPGLDVWQVSKWTLMGLVGLGSDIRMSDNFGLRLEVGDRFWDATLTDAATAQTSDEDLGKVTHEIYGQIGAHMLLGLVAPEVVAVAPPPPPPAPVTPAPTPEPEPVEEQITVCVIDPAAPTGIRSVNAIYLPETRDTMVVVNGTRQRLSTTLPANVMLASQADWFVRGEPLALELAPDLTLEYTTWQSGRVIPATDLEYLGTVRGLPVYASANDVQDIRADLRELRRAQMNDDLDDILDERADIRGEIEDIEYLYVPLRPTGCVFQTVQQVEQVRKK